MGEICSHQNLVDDRPQQLSHSKYLMNSASSTAEMTLNRLNFASKLTPDHPPNAAFPLEPYLLHQRSWRMCNYEIVLI